MRHLARNRQPLQLNPLPKHQAVGAAAKMEHAQLVALVDLLAGPNGDITGGHLAHTDADKRHQADSRVMRVDDDDGARGRRAVVLLGGDLAGEVDAVLRRRHLGLRVGDALEERLGVVSAGDGVGLVDGAGDGGVPAVVAEGGEEGLVDGGVGEVGVGDGVVGEHVLDGVGLGLDPEAVAGLDAVGDLVGGGLAGVGDDGLVVGVCDGADARAVEAGEEVVPGGEAVVGGGGVADVEVFEGVGGSACFVGDGAEVWFGGGAEPAVGALVDALCGGWGGEEGAPCVEDFLEGGVDVRVEVGGVAGGGAHGPVEDGVDGEADEADAVGHVGPGGGRGDEVVEDVEEVVVVSDLGGAGGIGGVGAVAGEFLEHGGDEEVDAGVGFDELFELVEGGMERLAFALVDVGNDAAEPFVVGGVG